MENTWKAKGMMEKKVHKEEMAKKVLIGKMEEIMERKDVIMSWKAQKCRES